jgi:hypothetical protein
MRIAIVLGALALGTGVPVTVLPRPAFPTQNYLGYAPNGLVQTSSRYQAPGNLENDFHLAPANSFRGLPGQSLVITANRTFGIYGKDGSTGRYLVAYDKRGHALYAFDFANYGWPPRIRKGEREFVWEQPLWAEERSGVLYVENAHSTYARSSYGQNAYITAIDLKTKRFLWRSAPLVANAQNFLVTRRYVVTGYGFTDEPDYLFALDRRTGQVAALVKLPNAPERITWQGTAIRVRTYDHVVVVRLRNT